MKMSKIFKWGRRLLISLVTDRYWRSGFVRIGWFGSRSGGAYVDLRYLAHIRTVYSFGIASEISFDRAIIKASGCEVYGFDPDPASEKWLRREDIWVPPSFHFSRLALYYQSGTHAFAQVDSDRMSGSLTILSGGKKIDVQCRTLTDIMMRLGHDWVDSLKMDIEGAEFSVLENWISTYEQLPIGQLWVEFHPDNVRWRMKDLPQIVESLRQIGMIPAYRNYFRYPNSYLLINKRLCSL